MYELQLIERLPLWLIYLASVALVLASIWGGHALSRALRTGADAAEAPLGSVVGAALGLLAFMLAFTFGIAVDRRDSKHDLLLREANAIGTLYLRADFLDEPRRSEVRALLRRYVDLRLEVAGHSERFREAVAEAKEIHAQLWLHAAALRDAELRNAQLPALFVAALNEVIDLQTTRVARLYYRVPTTIWWVLAGLTVLSMATVGYQFERRGAATWVIDLALAMSFSAVIVLIADLDRVTSDLLRVGNEPMRELQASMEAG